MKVDILKEYSDKALVKNGDHEVWVSTAGLNIDTAFDFELDDAIFYAALSKKKAEHEQLRAANLEYAREAWARAKKSTLNMLSDNENADDALEERKAYFLKNFDIKDMKITLDDLKEIVLK